MPPHYVEECGVIDVKFGATYAGSISNSQRMLTFLRDPIWQPIGVFIAGVIAFFLYHKQKSRKSLSCRLLAETELFQHVNGKFQTTYDGHPVQNVSLIIIKVINDGTVP